MTSLSMLPQCLLLFILVIINAQPGILQGPFGRGRGGEGRGRGRGGEGRGRRRGLPTFIGLIGDGTSLRFSRLSSAEGGGIAIEILARYKNVFVGFSQYGGFAKDPIRLTNIEDPFRRLRQQSEEKQDDNAPLAAAPAKALAPPKIKDLPEAFEQVKATFAEKTKTVKEFQGIVVALTDAIDQKVRVKTLAKEIEEDLDIPVVFAQLTEGVKGEDLEAVAYSKEEVIHSNSVDEIVSTLKRYIPPEPPKKSPPTKILPLPCKSDSTSCPPYTEQTCGQTYPCPPPCPPCPNPPCPPCPAQPKPCPCLKPPCPCPCPGQPCIPPKPVKCPKAPYTKVGCFDLPKAMTRNIIWITPGVAPKNMPSWKKYLSILVCQCSKAAKRRGFSYFGVKYFKPGKRSVFYRGACLTAPNSRVNRFTQLFKSDSKACLDSSKGVCNIQDKNDCIGNTKKSVFCYKRTDDTEESEDDSEDSDGVDGAQDATDGDDSHTTDDNGEKDDDSDDTEDATDAKLIK